MEIKPSKRSARRVFATTAVLALGVTGALGAQGLAVDDEGPEADSSLGSEALISRSQTNFDETIVSKFIPAAHFDGANVDADGDTCVTNSSGGSLQAPVELPDRARIKQIAFYGEDNSAQDISIRLLESTFDVDSNLLDPLLPATTTRSETEVDSFQTSGSPGDVIVQGTDDLNELAGSPTGLSILDPLTKFHTVEVELAAAAGTDHVLCGVVVDYQVSAPADAGTVFHPVGPIRAFDSRQSAFSESGRLGPNDTKVIDVTNGYDENGALIPSQEDVVPSDATAVAYNITVAAPDGPNFVAVTAGDASSFTASAINYTAGTNIANGSSVTVASDQTIKLWGGNNTGSSHVIIDIVGYDAPPVEPNMAN